MAIGMKRLRHEPPTASDWQRRYWEASIGSHEVGDLGWGGGSAGLNGQYSKAGRSAPVAGERERKWSMRLCMEGSSCMYFWIIPRA